MCLKYDAIIIISLRKTIPYPEIVKTGLQRSQSGAIVYVVFKTTSQICGYEIKR